MEGIQFDALVTHLDNFYVKKNHVKKYSTYHISIILHHIYSLNSYKACLMKYLHYVNLKKMGKTCAINKGERFL
jgi:hypothetical protein